VTDPRVVNRRSRPHDCDPIYVGRPTVWGNPFTLGRDGDRAEVIAKYRAWLLAQPDLVERARRELRGRDLECWCAPLACHADVLLEVANANGRGRTPARRGGRAVGDARELRALTLIQPWAWAIAHAGKTVENRTWRPPRSMLGNYLAIHAGKTRVDAAAVEDLREVASDVPLLFDLGAIVCVARLVGWVRDPLAVEGSAFAGITKARADLVVKSIWWSGPVGWVLDEVVAIEPVPILGAQGLWTVPPAVADVVWERLTERPIIKPGCCADRRAGAGVRVDPFAPVREGPPGLLPPLCDDTTCMRLPAGSTCGHCRHLARCVNLFGCASESTTCDFFPRRFAEARRG